MPCPNCNQIFSPIHVLFLIPTLATPALAAFPHQSFGLNVFAEGVSSLQNDGISGNAANTDGDPPNWLHNFFDDDIRNAGKEDGNARAVSDSEKSKELQNASKSSSSSLASSTTPAETTNDNGSSSLSTGAIIVIVVTIALFLLFCVIIFVIYKNRNKNRGKRGLPRSSQESSPLRRHQIISIPMVYDRQSVELNRRPPQLAESKSILLSRTIKRPAGGSATPSPYASPARTAIRDSTINTDDLDYVPVLMRRATGRVKQVKGGPRYLDPAKNALIPILSLLDPDPNLETTFERCIVSQLGNPASIPLGESHPGLMGLEFTCLPLRTYSAYERPDAIQIGESSENRLSRLSFAAESRSSMEVQQEPGRLRPGEISVKGCEDIAGRVKFRVAYPHVPTLPDEVELRYGDVVVVS
ncbi:hypothetical protein HDU97_004595 [Phlyctochytrium planicorne]|nr:hypothetical protein HDU97_004595 [Phlyctochytrium planicorne]